MWKRGKFSFILVLLLSLGLLLPSGAICWAADTPIQTYESAQSNLSNLYAQLKTLSEKLKLALADSQSNLQTLQQELSNLKQEIESLKSQLQLSAQELTELSSQLQLSQAESQTLRDLLTQSQDSLTNSEAQFQAYQQQAEKEIRRLKSERLIAWAVAVLGVLFGVFKS